MVAPFWLSFGSLFGYILDSIGEQLRSNFKHNLNKFGVILEKCLKSSDAQVLSC